MSVKENFESILERVRKAANRSGRREEEISLIAVTKHSSLEQMREVLSLSLKDFGESRLQKALVKQKVFPEKIDWHFIGPIQSNKAISIASHFSYIHSVSSFKIAQLLSEFGEKRGEKVKIFFQIDLSKEGVRNGFNPSEFLSHQETLLALRGLSIQGLMTMAPHTEDKGLIRACFRSLFELKRSLVSTCPFLSMGMSKDFEIAIEEGATHIRIGSELFL